MKKVLFITFGLGIGGPNPSLNAIYKYLRNHYDIHVFSIVHRNKVNEFSFEEVLLPEDTALASLFSNLYEQKGLFRIQSLFYKTIRVFLSLWGVDFKLLLGRRIVRRLESETNYDYIVAFMEGFATQFGSLFHSSNKVAWVHCNYNMYLPFGETEEEIYRQYSRIVCVSKYTADLFCERYPSLKERTTAIYNLVDVPPLLSLSTEPIDDKRFSNKLFTILSVGRFHNVKRFREIPFIASQLKERGDCFCWYILGPNTDKEEMLSYEANLKKYNVSDCVRWLGAKANPYPYFKAANLFVCISESEACPIVFNEAKVFGLPIVTTDFPSSYEFIHKDEGRIVCLSDIPKAISSYIDNPYKRDSLIGDPESNYELIEQLHQLFNL